MFSFNYELNDNDYYEYYRHHVFNAPANKKRMLVARTARPLLYLVLALLLGSIIEFSIISYVVFGTMAAAVLIFFKPLTNRRIKRQLARMKKAGKLPYAHDISVTFFEDYIEEKTEQGETKQNYSQLERVDSAETAVCVYNSSVTASIIPNRAFRDNTEREEFISFVRSKIPAQ